MRHKKLFVEPLENRTAPSSVIHIIFDGYPDARFDNWHDFENPLFPINNETPAYQSPEKIPEIIDGLEMIFHPFDVIFTTEHQNDIDARFVIGGSGDWWGTEELGIAIQGSYGDRLSPGFTFAELFADDGDCEVPNIVSTTAHEIGHMLGLDHAEEFTGRKSVGEVMGGTGCHSELLWYEGQIEEIASKNPEIKILDTPIKTIAWDHSTDPPTPTYYLSLEERKLPLESVELPPNLEQYPT